MQNQELKNILLLKSEDLDEQQLNQINELRFNPVTLQLLNFEYNQFQQSVEQAISQLAQYDGLAFNSVNSVKAVAQTLKHQKIELKVRIFCVGKKTKELITSLFGIEPQIVAKSQEELSEKIKEQNVNGSLLYFIGNLSNLKANFNNTDKLQIKECLCYSTQNISKEQLLSQLLAKKKIYEKNLHAIVYYSPSNTQFLLENIQFLKENNVDLNISSVSKHIAFGKKTLNDLQKFKEIHKISDNTVFVCENSTFDDILQILSKNL
ncbi:hypothetical protein ABPG72_001633 [Tetrahymena utriculariae]